jgi:hypothetical protein
VRFELDASHDGEAWEPCGVSHFDAVFATSGAGRFPVRPRRVATQSDRGEWPRLRASFEGDRVGLTLETVQGGQVCLAQGCLQGDTDGR